VSGQKRSASFTPLNAGIWSPELWGRQDLARYPAAQADALNMIPLVLGGQTRRPGTLDIAATNDNAAAWLGRFVFNEDQSYILEWTPGKLRFVERGALIQSGGTPYQIATPYSAQHLPLIRSAQSADVVYLACAGMRPYKLSRYGRTNWTLEPVTFRDGPYRDPWPSMPAASLSGGVMMFTADVATADWIGQCVRVRIDGKWYWLRITGFTDAQHIAVASEDGATPPPVPGPAGDTILDTITTEVGSGETYTLPNSWLPYMTGVSSVDIRVDTQALTGGQHYTLGDDRLTLDFTPPLLRGSTISIVNRSLSARPAASATGLVEDWRAPAWGGDRGWPQALALFEQRTWWAGPPAEPLSEWGTFSGDYEMFRPTEEDGKVLGDSGIYMIAADQEVAEIRWLMPGETLAMGTAGGEYVIRASDLGEALTAENANIRPATSEGSARVEPIRAGKAIAFVGLGGRNLHLLAYSAETDDMQAPDAAQMAEHLLEAGIVQIAWCRRPWSLLWCLLSDGTLASCTYSPRDQVMAWMAHRVTDGRVLSIASVPENGVDALYLVTERTGPDGQTRRRMERMADRWRRAQGEMDGSRAQLLDAAITVVSNTDIEEVTGLSHLEGRTVAIWADGARQPPQTVVNGRVPLDIQARRVHVGLSVPWYLETLDLDQGSAIGTGADKRKSIKGIGVYVLDTCAADVRVISDGQAGPPTELPARRADQPVNAGVVPYRGYLKPNIPGNQADSIRVRVEGDGPSPATILSLAITMDTQA